VRRALEDRSGKVRATAVRLAEPWLRKPGNVALHAAVLGKVDEDDAGVRLQVALSLGEMGGRKAEPALAWLLIRHAGQPFLAAAVASSLPGRELEFIEDLGRNETWARGQPAFAPALAVLAGAVFSEGASARVQRLLQWTAAAERPG